MSATLVLFAHVISCTAQLERRWRNGCKYIPTTVIHVALELAAGKSGVFVDVGAYFGFEAAQALDAGRQTVSLECAVDPYIELVGRKANGDCMRTPCCLLDDALRNGSAAVLLACASATTSLGTVHAGDDASSLYSGNVPDTLRRRVLGPKTTSAVVVPLDALLYETSRVAVLKIDAQGSEYPAMLGARRLLERDRPVVVYEWENSLPSNRMSAKPWHLLRALGYNCTKDFSYDGEGAPGSYGADWLCLVRDGSPRQQALLDMLACTGACAKHYHKDRGRRARRRSRM